MTPTSVVLLISAISFSVACASVRPNGSRGPQVISATRQADVIAGSWDKTEALRPDSPLVVTLKNGGHLKGGFKALGPGVLVLADPAGKEFGIPRSDVGKILALASDDLTNGAVIGATVGLGAALAVLAIAGSGEGFILPSVKWGAPILLSSMGSLVGILIDRAHKRQELIYLAP